MEKSRAVLIQYLNTGVEPVEDLGIGTMASILRQEGHDVVLLSMESNSNIDYEFIFKYKPEVIGLTLFRVNKKDVYTFCEKIKENDSSIKICIGGQLASDFDVEILNEAPFIDFILRGSGETGVLDLIRNGFNSLESVSGLSYRIGSEIKRNEVEKEPYAGTLPPPARDILARKKLKIACVRASSSCAGECSFCNYPMFNGKWKGFEVDSVIEEIKRVNSEYSIRFFQFIDRSLDNPGLNFERVRRLAKAIVESGLNISYMGCLKPNFLSNCGKVTLRLIKESGFVGSIIGVESANEHDLELYKKKVTLEEISRTLDICKEYEIVPQIGFINFNPYSTIGRLRENINFLKKYNLSWNMIKIASCLFPTYGSALYIKFKDLGLLTEDENDFNNTNYKFVDSEVEKLHAFVANIYNNNYNLIVLARYHFEVLPMIMFDLKRFLKYTDNDSMIESVNKSLGFLYEKQSILSKCLGNWFIQLLDITENGMQNEKAEAVTREFDIIRVLKSEIFQLVKNVDKLNNTLKKSNIEYDLLSELFFGKR